MNPKRKPQTGVAPRRRKPATLACLVRVKLSKRQFAALDTAKTNPARHSAIEALGAVPAWLVPLATKRQLVIHLPAARRESHELWLWFALTSAQVQRASGAGVKLGAAPRR